MVKSGVVEELQYLRLSKCYGFCRFMAVLNLLCCPFILLFLIIYFFMKNAERFYHHPSSAGARQWSSLAAWRLREFNELPHYLNHRCVHCIPCCLGFILRLPSSLLWPNGRGEQGAVGRARGNCAVDACARQAVMYSRCTYHSHH